ncbi:oligosaccharyl transferase, archaeosortase A system-associated [Haloarcula salinisoli]|uniref:dolichyl-phosphooligosaccharide-protein glycotransferase n=1 Tax=Haloarcula salinisoli TaxID=2487746 RepID=A0A8J8C785_9EURY|nr:oligosaccharyl transferase, archaeosortase A system-associated [Halomicroarcula salinisoli]MBX0303027.1 oligosaccharyl transferase, archaeosortase A system-associated [Halomicroarcula salinisoli]
MSHSRGTSAENPEPESTLDRVKTWYHVPALLLVLGFMLWNRAQNYSEYIVDGEVLFSGTDPWYHYRSTMYVVENWPATMPFDPWTYFPYGTRSGQFGTLMDQVFGTIALIIGLGDPSAHTVAMVALFAPAVMGTLAAIPTYYMGRRLAGRIGGVTAAGILALSAGLFLQRSIVGFYDHQVAEGLLQVTSILAVMVALSVGERDKPVYEQFLDRDVPALRATVGYSILAGVAISLYLWTWPPAVLLLGILGTFFLLWLTIEFVRGKSPEHAAIVGTVSLGTVAVLQLAVLQSLSISAVDHTLLQVLLAAAIAGGCVFMAWLARFVEANDYDRNLYPVAVGGILATITILTAVLTPDLFSYFVNQVLRVIGFTESPAATVTSVGEATPLDDPDRLYQYHGLALFAAIIGALLVLFNQIFDRDASADRFLMVVWFAFILAASFTQIRFGVYLVFPVAALSAVAVDYVVRWTDFSFDDGVAAYEVITIVALVLILTGPLLFAPGAAYFFSPTAVEVGEQAGPGQEPAAWTESMDWLQANSPQEGAYGTGGNGTLEYYGTYADRSDYDYGEGEYGVMSWWDYGHIITVQGERIPNANPFQQGATTAANFLLSPTETEANSVLNETDEDDAKTRYVAVDWKMANTYGGPGQGKFFAPPRFYDKSNVSRSDYFGTIRSRQSQQYFNYRTQDYYESMVVRLYEYHGSAKEPQSASQPFVYVVDWDTAATRSGQTVRATPADGSPAVKRFRTMEAARNYTESDATSQIGGFGAQPGERVSALEHYRYVGSSERSAYSSGAHNQFQLIESAFGQLPNQRSTTGDCTANQTTMPIGNQTYCQPDQAAGIMDHTNPAWTKIFERVEGGTIEGTAPANTTVEASVPMRNNVTGESFTYTQRVDVGADGRFEMTVPYSTTGYEAWGTDEGYTDVGVRAQGPYEFSIPVGPTASYPLNGTATVTEGQVIGENESATTVELTVPEGNQTVETNDTSTNTTTDGSTDGSSTDDTSTNETTTNDTAGSLARPAAEPAP